MRPAAAPAAGPGRPLPSSIGDDSAFRSAIAEAAFQSAPRDISSFTTSARSSPAATINAVWPKPFSFALTSAPVSTRRVTVSVLPDRAASISAVAPVAVAELALGAGGEQRRHHLRMPGLARHQERRDAAQSRRRANVGAGRQQHLRKRGIAVGRRPVQRGHAVALCGIDVGAVLQQRLHGRRIASLGRISDVGARRLKADGNDQHRDSQRSA